MAIQLVAGQTFAADYSILHPLESGSDWLALYEPTQERVRISLLEDCDAALAAKLDDEIQRLQPLVHPNLLRTYRIGETDQQYFSVSEYKKGLAPINLERPFNENWTLLKLLISAVEYAQSLGFYHGAISPSRILVASDGTPYLDGLGLPPLSKENDYLAPEVLHSNISAASDVYGIAQILHKLLTNVVWQPDQTSGNTPLDESVQPLLLAMLSDNPNARPEDFGSLITVLENNRSERYEAVSATSFARAVEVPEAVATPGTETQTHRLPRERNVISMPVALGGLAILLTLAFVLFFLVPDQQVSQPLPNNAAPESTANNDTTQTESTQTTAKPEDTAPVLAPMELARLEELRVKGKELAAELLRRQVEVEDVGGRLWAGDRYDRSTELGIEGDEAYRLESLALAVEKYTEGVDLLVEVLKETEDVFGEYIDTGIAALDSGDFEMAIEAYRILTRIRPEDKQLAAELERALNLEQVLRLTSEAEVMERNGDINAALASFKQAANLDALWSPATDGVKRVNNRIARNRFQDEMSKGFSALAKNEFEVAQAAFVQAQKILPSSKEPLDGLQQIELAKTQQQINVLMENARQLDSESRWEEAMPIYEEILGISPGLSSAESALKQATERAALRASLNKYVSQPHLMQNDEDLREARTALLAAARLDNDGLKPAVRELSHLVSLARIDVEVIVESDNRTDVTVFKVGQYGKINETRLSLIPGVYTFVGKRPGYRDIYQEIHIKGDTNPVRVSVRCTEKI
jgi:serine/threonine protein kinase